MSVLTDVREALRSEFASWGDLGITGLTWRGDLRPPKTDAAEDSPDDAGVALPMAGISMPQYTMQAEDEPLVIAQASTTRGAILSSGDAEAASQVRMYLAQRADYDAALLEFDRYWRWRAYDTSLAGSALAISTTLLDQPSEVRAYLGPEVRLATPQETAARDLWVVTWSILVRFPDLVEEVAGHGIQYVRVTLNDGPEFGPAETSYIQVEQDETDVDLEDGDSWGIDNASTGDP